MFAMTYTVAEDAVDQIAGRVETFLAALRQNGSPIHYASVRVADSARFIHVVDLSADPAALDSLPEFAEFQTALSAVIVGPPQKVDLTVVGSLGFNQS